MRTKVIQSGKGCYFQNCTYNIWVRTVNIIYAMYSPVGILGIWHGRNTIIGTLYSWRWSPHREAILTHSCLASARTEFVLGSALNSARGTGSWLVRPAQDVLHTIRKSCGVQVWGRPRFLYNLVQGWPSSTWLTVTVLGRITLWCYTHKALAGLKTPDWLDLWREKSRRHGNS